MFEFINQHSFTFIISIVLIVIFALTPAGNWRRRIPVYSTILIISVVTIVLLRPGDSSVSNNSDAQVVITSGSPVFVEFFSNTCTACLASEPIVKSLEGAIKDNVHVLKVNVQDPIASQLIRRYRAYVTPTFVVVGPDDEEVWHQSGGLLDKQAALEALGIGA